MHSLFCRPVASNNCTQFSDLLRPVLSLRISQAQIAQAKSAVGPAKLAPVRNIQFFNEIFEPIGMETQWGRVQWNSSNRYCRNTVAVFFPTSLTSCLAAKCVSIPSKSKPPSAVY